ncbi:MAG: M1 family metallopeptidase [Planctomycetaceae bacterium]|nr:M1 family metallopeptidase [Planctomycetaceae bacterium]
MNMKRICNPVIGLLLLGLVLSGQGMVMAQPPGAGSNGRINAFRQLEELLPTPNSFRTASGAPGPYYWQQRADYDIQVELDDEKQRIIGSETITYTNHSSDPLYYLWLQLDANIFAPDSDANTTLRPPALERVSTDALHRLLFLKTFDGSLKITSVMHDGKKQPYTIVKTMMRIDLAEPLTKGQQFTFSIDWNYQINDSSLVRARTGFEYFEQDKNYLYEIAHWFPRMVAYTDATGWQHKQFLGRGEFTLELGNYEVKITVPNDHIVAATGVLQNPDQVLTAVQQERMGQARKAKTPVFIVTPEEAKKKESQKPTGKKTWSFAAENVRDFAFASSRKFIWDALPGPPSPTGPVMAMSYYPKEAEPLWSKYSTHAIVHTLEVYSRYTFPYPYPVAISVNGPVYGMEYPMICFNGPRPEKDGTYSKRTKYSLISVIIHEVGHNYFPMIVNSDERQWTWMDEGINTFLQFLAEQEWEDHYPSRRGEPKDIVGYMSSSNQVPIMTNSELIQQFGNNAYAKPATALNILRESILGRELFDFAFKEYARRWQFKRPMPADFFRTMEDASGVDLDWFWRGWFYSTAHTDFSIEAVKLYTMKSPDPETEKKRVRDERAELPATLSRQRNEETPKRTHRFEELKDFYNTYDELDVTEQDRKAYQRFLKGLNDRDKKVLEQSHNFYVVDLKNLGGLVMPVIFGIEYEDGHKEQIRMPAEIWRRNNQQVSKLVITPRTIKKIILDPNLETADTNLENNYFPRQVLKSRFQVFKERKQPGNNPLKASQAKPMPKKPADKPKKENAEPAKKEGKTKPKP